MNTEKIDRDIAQLHKCREVVLALPESTQYDVYTGGCDITLRCGHSTAATFRADIKDVREYIRNAIPDWKDRLGQIWGSGRSLIVSYVNDSWPVELWLDFDPDDFPSELLGDTCRIEKEQVESEEYYIACDRS